MVGSASRDRTEDYQRQLGIKTTRRMHYLCRNQGLVDCTPATAESWLKAFERAPLGQVQSFHASGSAKDLGLKYSYAALPLLLLRLVRMFVVRYRVPERCVWMWQVDEG